MTIHSLRHKQRFDIKKLHVLLILLFLSPNVFSQTDSGTIPHDELGVNLSSENISVSNFKGKVVVISFWATWCEPCMKEIPILSSIQKKVGTDELQVVAINYKEKKNVFRSVSEALKDNPMIVTYDRNSKVARKYDVKAIPHMVLVDRDGEIAFTHVGYSAESLPDLIEEINTLLLRSRS